MEKQGMSGAQYYLRSRGRITGPFAAAVLLRLVRRGMITPVDEISEDRRSWVRAEEYEDLFPPLAAALSHAHQDTTVSTTGQQESHAEPAQATALPSSAALPGGDLRYFYQQGGATVGPLPMAILVALAGNGTLQPKDIVWQEGAQTTLQADQLTQLAPVFFGKDRFGSSSSAGPLPSTAQRPTSNVDPARLKKSTLNVHGVVLMSSIIVSVIVLLALHCPYGSLNGRLIGWWTLVNATGERNDAVVVMVFAIITMSLSAVAAIVLTAVLRGVPRAITFLVLGALGIVTYLVGIFTTPSVSLTLLVFAVFLLIPVSAGGLAAVVRSRGLVGGGDTGKALQGVFAGLLGICGLVVAIVTVPLLIRGVEFGNLFVGFILLVIAQLVLVASAVMGFIGLKPTFSVSLNMVTKISAQIGNGLLLASFVIMVLDLGSLVNVFSGVARAPYWSQPMLMGIDQRFLVILLGSRMLLVLLYYPILLILGLEELANALIITPSLRVLGRR